MFLVPDFEKIENYFTSDSEVKNDPGFCPLLSYRTIISGYFFQISGR